MTDKELCCGKTFKEVMKEVEFHISDKQRIAKFEKENAELKAQIEQLQQAYTITVDKSVKREQDLETQIEKMKCCGNCKYYYCSNDTKGKCKLLNPNTNKCGFNICDKWELAE